MPVKATRFSAASKIKPVDDPCKLSRCSLLKPHPGLHSFPCKIVQNNSIWASFQYSDRVRVGQMDSTCKLHLAELVRCQKRQCLVALHAHYFYLLTTHLPVAIVASVGRSPILTADRRHSLHFTMHSRAILSVAFKRLPS